MRSRKVYNIHTHVTILYTAKHVKPHSKLALILMMNTV